ncbi:DUF1015 family protein [Nocardioides sp.]|uniref:DUF1015 family protein n=1 Tax=Nocardioides sp. TaxID=35761 RepID=UPI00356B5629
MDPREVVNPPFVAGPLHLRPFRGLMLASRRIGDPASARAFARPYSEVGNRLETWVRNGHATRDAEPAVYLHEYSADGIVVRGLVGALDVSRRTDDQQARAVYPHEGIHPEQAEELAGRMSRMQVNPAPILLVHHGSDELRALVAQIMTAEPDHAFSDRSGQEHRLWAIRDAVTLAALDDALAGSRALVADGHHRYAAYLAMQREAPGTAADLGLAMLVDQDDTPLFLGAIHRFFVGLTLDHVRQAAATLGATYRELDQEPAVAALGPTTAVVTDGSSWASLDLHVPATRALVEVLHEDLLSAMPRRPSRTAHHHSMESALEHAGRTAGLAFLMPAPDFDLVLQIVASGRLLPEKATSFQPKPSLGVLIRSLPDG